MFRLLSPALTQAQQFRGI